MKELKDLGIDYESDPQTKNKLKDATEEEQIDVLCLNTFLISTECFQK